MIRPTAPKKRSVMKSIVASQTSLDQALQDPQFADAAHVARTPSAQTLNPKPYTQDFIIP